MAAGPCPPHGAPEKSKTHENTIWAWCLGRLRQLQARGPPTEGATPPQPLKVISQLHGIYPRPSFCRFPLPPAFALALKSRHSTACDGTEPCAPTRSSEQQPPPPWELVRNVEPQAPTQSSLDHHMQFK